MPRRRSTSNERHLHYLYQIKIGGWKCQKAKAEADARFNKKAYEQIAFIWRRDADVNADVVRAHAKSMGESVNAFLKRAVMETIERDNAKTVNEEE